MYRRYYSYNDMPAVPVKKEECTENNERVRGENTAVPVHNEYDGKHAAKSPAVREASQGSGKILGKFEPDDVLLLVVILVLLFDDCDDNMLLLALFFVFLSGIS